MPHPTQTAFALLVAFAAGATAEPVPANAITGVRHWTLGEVTRVVVQTTADFQYRTDRVSNPDRLFFDLESTRIALGQKGQITFPVNDPRLRQIRVALTQPGVSRVVFDLEPEVQYTASRLANPPRLIVELRTAAPQVLSATPPASAPLTPPAVETVKTNPPPVLPSPAPAPKLAPPPAKAANLGVKPSMTRALGLKIGRVVLDPGHGGHDTGTVGRGGLLEKDLVLDVCMRLGALIESRLGAQVVFTRTDDTFIPLERRTEIANEQKADLFLSVHANSSPASASSGVESYYLNFTDNKLSMEVAARENASSEKTVFELKDLVGQIARQEKKDESREFAELIQSALYKAARRGNSRTRDRGVRTAPFIVLIGAEMPSVLAEIGFVSNPRDEILLKKADMRQRIAEGLYHGISGYVSTLSHFEVAQTPSTKN